MNILLKASFIICFLTVFLIPRAFSQIAPAISFNENPVNHNMHITSDGAFFYTINGGNAGTGQVNKFTLAGVLVQTYPIQIDGRGMSWNPVDGLLYVSTYMGDIVKITNLAAGTFVTVFTGIMQNGQASFGMSTDGSKFYDFYAGTLKIHNMTTGVVITTLTGLQYGIGSPQSGDGAVAVDASNLIYTWNANTKTVYVYNQLGVLTTTMLLQSGNYGFSLSYANCYLFVSNDGNYSTGTWFGYNISCCPTATINYAGSPYCISLNTAQAATLTGSGAFTGGTYSATPAGLSLNTATGAVTPNLSTAGTYVVTYTIPANGSCPVFTSTDTVVVNPPPTVSVPSNVVACNNASVAATTFVSTPTGGTFAWTNSNPAIGLAASGIGNILSFTATNTGNLPINATITVTPTINGCVGTPSSYMITVNPTPVLTATATPATICSGASLSLDVTSTVTGTTYMWVPGNLTTNPATVSPTTTTTYTVAGSATSCTASATVLVTVNPQISVTATAAPTTICGGQNATLTATGAATYMWIPGNLPGASVTVAPIATTTYTVGGSSLGCTASATVTITVSNTVTPTFNPLPAFCIGSAAPLLPTTSTNGITGTWNPSIVNNTTSATYTFTPTVGQCASTTTVTSTINPKPTVTATASPTSVCSGQTSALTGAGASTYNWMPANISGSPVNVIPSATTIYTVVGTSTDGCTGTSTVQVNLITEAMVTFTTLPHEGCSPLNVQFKYSNDGTLDTTSLHWDFGVPTTNTDTSNLLSPSYTYMSSGFFHITLTAWANSGCMAIGHDSIKVIPPPVANFTPNPEYTDMNFPTIHFYNESVNAYGWLWLFGDQNSNYAIEEFPDHTYLEPGTYPVTQIAYNSLCSDTITKYVHLNEAFSYYIPNAFSPTADGMNDVFNGHGIGYKTDDFDLYIFDRWGEKIFFTNNPEQGWDGKVNGKGKVCSGGIYVYKIRVVDLGNIEHRYVGSVMLLR